MKDVLFSVIHLPYIISYMKTDLLIEQIFVHKALLDLLFKFNKIFI